MITKHKNIKKIGLILSCAVLANFALAGFAGIGRAWAQDVMIENSGGSRTAGSGGDGSIGGAGNAPEKPQTAVLPYDNLEGVLNAILVTITAGIGVVAAISIVVAGVIYTTAGGDSAKVGKAKTMIQNTVVGLFAYAFMWAFLNWLIPGGVF